MAILLKLFNAGHRKLRGEDTMQIFDTLLSDAKVNC
jgi:hypothetical protein